MDYAKFQNLAIKLLSKFGSASSVHLRKYTGVSGIDPVTKRTVKSFKLYSGYGVKLKYATEAIGSLDNIIKAGDVKILCYFPEEPSEQKDQIIFRKDTFNIINVEKIDPDSDTVVLYSVQCRRA